jgi:acyl-CoA thioester hydrolase
VAHQQKFKLGLDGVDAFGIIYFGQYCHWFQHAIEGLFSEAGHELGSIIADGVGFPMARVEMAFFKPVRLSEVVDAECSVIAAGKRSVQFLVRFTDAAGDLTAEVRTVQVATRIDFTPESVPDWLRETMEPPLTDGPGISTLRS